MITFKLLELNRSVSNPVEKLAKTGEYVEFLCPEQ